MGSTSGALISHLQFNLNNHSCFNRFESIRTHLNCVQAHHSRRPKLRLQSRKSTRSVICFAVDDDLRERQQDLGGVGSAVEDRPGKTTTHVDKLTQFFIALFLPPIVMILPNLGTPELFILVEVFWVFPKFCQLALLISLLLNLVFVFN